MLKLKNKQFSPIQSFQYLFVWSVVWAPHTYGSKVTFFDFFKMVQIHFYKKNKYILVYIENCFHICPRN